MKNAIAVSREYLMGTFQRLSPEGKILHMTLQGLNNTDNRINFSQEYIADIAFRGDSISTKKRKFAKGIQDLEREGIVIKSGKSAKYKTTVYMYSPLLKESDKTQNVGACMSQVSDLNGSNLTLSNTEKCMSQVSNLTPMNVGACMSQVSDLTKKSSNLTQKSSNLTHNKEIKEKKEEDVATARARDAESIATHPPELQPPPSFFCKKELAHLATAPSGLVSRCETPANSAPNKAVLQASRRRTVQDLPPSEREALINVMGLFESQGITCLEDVLLNADNGRYKMADVLQAATDMLHPSALLSPEVKQEITFIAREGITSAKVLGKFMKAACAHRSTSDYQLIKMYNAHVSSLDAQMRQKFARHLQKASGINAEVTIDTLRCFKPVTLGDAVNIMRDMAGEANASNFIDVSKIESRVREIADRQDLFYVV